MGEALGLSLLLANTFIFCHLTNEYNVILEEKGSIV